VSTDAGFPIEALSASHDRSRFASGVPELDEYLRRQAGQDARRRVAAPFVAVDAAGRVLGYYTLSAYGVKLGALPPALQNRLPRYPLVPATLLGRLAVDQDARGRGLGRLLLMDALHRSWRNSRQVASAGVMVDAIDDAARAFYLHHEFIALPGEPRRLFLAMGTVERLFGAE